MTSFVCESGEVIEVLTLSRRLCEAHAIDLLSIHNSVLPHQWSIGDLLSDADTYRVFYGKWDVSRVAFSQSGVPIGVCIGFERLAEPPVYPVNCVYMHRLAVAATHQGIGVGIGLHCAALDDVFERGLELISAPSRFYVFGQADAAPWNERTRCFHRDAGFAVVGEKRYPDRVDLVMRMSRQAFYRSRHFERWRISKRL